jgi:hypothetical protein
VSPFIVLSALITHFVHLLYVNQIRHLGPVKSSARRQGLLEGVDMATGQSWEEVWAEAAKRGEVSVAPEATIRAGL